MSDMITYFGPVDKYGGVIQFSSDTEGTHSVYSDRMYGWNSEKYNECCQKIWNNMGQCFYEDRRPEDVERFLRLYTGDDTLVLCKIIRYENQSNGYPYWRFDYTSNKK
jgi:hypothetical protein